MSLHVLAQNHPFRQYTVEDGLPTNYVYGAIEDRDGIMWVYTENGIARFDGVHFRNYSTMDGLPHNDVYLLKKDGCGTIWIVNIGKSSAYIEGDSVINQPDVTPANALFNINDKVILVNDYTSLEVMKCPGEALKIESFKMRSDFPLNDSIVLFRDTTNLKYINLISNDTMDTEFHYKRIDLLAYFVKQGELDYMIIRGDESLTIIDEYFNQKSYRHSEISEGRNRLYSFHCMEDGTVVYETENKSFYVDTTDLSLKAFLDIPSISDQYNLLRVYQDSKGNYWQGTVEGGLFFINKKVLKTYNYNHQDFNNNFEKIVIFRDKLYAITDALSMYEIVNDQLTMRIEEAVNHRFEDVVELDNQLYFFGGLLPIVFDGNEFLAYDVDSYQGDRLMRVGNIEEYPLRGAKSLATNTEGDSIVYGTSLGYYLYLKDKKVLSYIERLRLDQISYFSSQFYASAGSGFYRFDGSKFIKILSAPSQISHFAEVNGEIWICTTHSGIYKYQKDHFSTIIPNINSVTCLKREGDDIFLGSKTGVYWLDQDLNLVYRYGKMDGLRSEEVADIHITSKYIYVATNHGLSRIDRSHDIETLDNLPLNISSIMVNGVKRSSDDLVDLSHEENSVEVNCHFVDYQSEGNIDYSYRLHPAMSEAVTTSDPHIVFSNLSPNNYELEINASGASGNTSVTKIIPISIKSPYWNTWWFYLIGLGSLGLLTWQYVRWSSKKEQEKIKKQQELDRELASLKMESLKSQMNPHFIFNALGSIQYYIQTHQVDEADMYLAKFAKLMRRYLHSATEDLVSIEEEVSMLEDYIALEQMRFDFSFKHKISIDENIAPDVDEIPALILQPFIENAILHGLHCRKDKNGLLNIDFSKQGDIITCLISDNGIGISRSLAQKSSNHKSKAVKNIKSRMEAINAIGNIKMNKEVSALSDDPELPGTKIKLTFEVLEYED